MKHLVQDDQVHAAGGHAEVVHVTVAELDVVEVGPAEGSPRDGEHAMGAVDAERPTGTGREQTDDASGTGADVEQVADGARAGQVQQHALHFLLGDMEGTDVVPLVGVRLEVAVGSGLSGALDGEQALAIAGEGRVGRVEQRDDGAGDAVIGESVKHPAALGDTVEQSGIAEEPQVARDAWLALPQDLCELADGEFGAPEGGEHAEARGFRRCPERLEQVAEARRAGGGIGRAGCGRGRQT